MTDPVEAWIAFYWEPYRTGALNEMPYLGTLTVSLHPETGKPETIFHHYGGDSYMPFPDEDVIEVLWADEYDDPDKAIADFHVAHPPEVNTVDQLVHTQNGWIDRKGQIFACGRMGHRGLAERCAMAFDVAGVRSKRVHLTDEEDQLTIAGWLRISEAFVGWSWEKRLTKAQRRTLERLQGRLPHIRHDLDELVKEG